MRVLAFILISGSFALVVSGCTQFLSDIQKTGLSQNPDKVDYNFGGEK